MKKKETKSATGIVAALPWNGKGGEQQLHLSCVNAVNSIYCEEMLFVPRLMNKLCGLHLL